MSIIKEHADFIHLKEFGGLELLEARYHHKQFSRHVHEGYCIGVIEGRGAKFLSYRSATYSTER